VRVVIQRVSHARVLIDQTSEESITQGVVVLVGVAPDDTSKDIEWLVKKLLVLRLFDDASGFMNKSIVDISGEFLIISQFTLFASVKKGTRPSLSNAAPPAIAEPLYEQFVEKLKSQYTGTIREGVFGADMKVLLENDGPVTLIIDSKNK